MVQPDRIDRETLFSIMGRLSLHQRSVLVLKHFDKMKVGQIAYIMEMAYWKVLLYLLWSYIKLKKELVISGYHRISLSRFLMRFQRLTQVVFYS